MTFLQSFQLLSSRGKTCSLFAFSHQITSGFGNNSIAVTVPFSVQLSVLNQHICSCVFLDVKQSRAALLAGTAAVAPRSAGMLR